MKLRTRLGLGIVSITIILLVPLILALRSLDQVHQTTRTLRDREFAASLLLGSFRELTDDVKRTEDAILFVKDSSSIRLMQKQINRLASTSDSLSRFVPRQSAADLSNAILALRAATEAEYAAANAGADNTAEEISAQRTRPALLTIDRVMAKTESRLRDETHDRVEQAAQPDALVCAADEDRREDRFLDALAQAGLEFGVGDLLALEILGEHVVVGFGRRLEQLIAARGYF